MHISLIPNITNAIVNNITIQMNVGIFHLFFQIVSLFTSFANILASKLILCSELHTYLLHLVHYALISNLIHFENSRITRVISRKFSKAGKLNSFVGIFIFDPILFLFVPIFGFVSPIIPPYDMPFYLIHSHPQIPIQRESRISVFNGRLDWEAERSALWERKKRHLWPEDLIASKYEMSCERNDGRRNLLWRS